MTEPSPRSAVQNLNTFHAIAAPDLCIAAVPSPHGTAARARVAPAAGSSQVVVEKKRRWAGRAPLAASGDLFCGVSSNLLRSWLLCFGCVGEGRVRLAGQGRPGGGEGS
jgi:hypothetical protein